MKVNDNYKFTEIGVLPGDWNATALEIVALIQRGTSPRPIDNPIWFDENSSTGWLRISDVSRAKKYLLETVQNLSDKGIANSRFVARDNLVMSICATVGRPIITRKDVCIHDGFVVFNSLTVNKEYLYYVLSDIEKNWSKHGQTGSQMNLNTGLINSTKIPLPPTKKEQIAIATVLSDVDALITQLEKLITKKRQIKQGAMQILLNPFDKNGSLKDGWKVKKLGEICPDIEKGQLITSNAIADGNIPVVAGGKQPAYFHDTPNRKGITITVSASGANAGYVNLFDIPIFASDCSTISESDNYEIYYIYYCMLLKQNEIYKSQTGGAQPHIHPKDLQPLMIGMPVDINQQENISIVLKNMDSEITALENKLAKIQKLKQGMMQKLLTGQIRLIQPRIGIPIAQKPKASHNQHFHEAVIIAVLTDTFGSSEYPLGRKRYTKLSYLLHRHQKESIDAYQKKAAGPYNPETRYKGAERIALDKGYITQHKKGDYEGFIASEGIPEAKHYFSKWYSQEVLTFLEQFRYKKNDALELLTTIDNAVVDLKKDNNNISLVSVKEYIASIPKWRPKLDRKIFSDDQIIQTINELEKLWQ